MTKQFLGKAALLQPYLDDITVTDILINGTQSLYVDRSGKLERVSSPFEGTDALIDFIERLLVPIGRRIDASQPYVDGKLLDGSRFHVILPPIAPHGPIISIRKFRDAGARADLAAFGAPSWLADEVRAGKNILISGGTGAGKTTLLTCLLEVVSEDERIAVVEETAEIRLLHPHVVYLEARPPTPDGVGEVTLRQLIRNTLRMRPDRVVLGECRGGEAFDMLQAMNTGHRGSLCTLHANGPLDALRRLESLTLLAGVGVSHTTIREWIAAAIDLVIHLERRGAARRIHRILQIEGLEGEVYRQLPRFSG